jgi:hypothetical protein
MPPKASRWAHMTVPLRAILTALYVEVDLVMTIVVSVAVIEKTSYPKTASTTATAIGSSMSTRLWPTLLGG